MHRAVSFAGDQVGRQQTSGSHGAAQDIELALVPGMRTEDVGLSGQINVVDHYIETTLVRAQPVVGIGVVDLDPVGVEVHVGAGEFDDALIDVDGREFHLRQQVAEDPEGRATGESEHEDRTRWSRGTEQGTRRKVVPGQAC